MRAKSAIKSAGKRTPGASPSTALPDKWKRRAAKIAVGSVVAAACGLFAVRSVVHLKRESEKKRDWKVMDAKLDLSLEHAGNTSEPTAAY